LNLKKRKINCYNFRCYFICFILFNNKIGEIKKGKEKVITAVVNNKNMKKKKQQRKINIIKNQKRIPHTIVNIPKDGVYLGVCVIFLIIFIFEIKSCFFFFLL
jgi:hypothetical protein